MKGVEGNDADFGGLKTAEFPMSELGGGIGLFYGIQQHRDVPRFPAIGGRVWRRVVFRVDYGVLCFLVSTLMRIDDFVFDFVFVFVFNFGNV